MNSHQRRVAHRAHERAHNLLANRYVANLAPPTPAVRRVWSRLLEEQSRQPSWRGRAIHIAGGGQFIFPANQLLDEMRIDIMDKINQQISKYASTHSCKQCGEPLYQHAYGIDVDNHQYSIVFRCIREPIR